MKSENRAKSIIGILSIIVVFIVAYIDRTPVLKPWFDTSCPYFDKSILPFITSIFNTIVSILLLIALYFIRKKDILNHKRAMLTAVFFSGCFFINYLFYHSICDLTRYGTPGLGKTVYLLLLISHIILAAVSFPFILFTLYKALINDFEGHRKVAKFTWYLWFYVAVSGVIVYWMIRPFYA
jgi:putative membrane protein